MTYTHLHSNTLNWVGQSEKGFIKKRTSLEKPDLAVCLLTLVGQWPLDLLMIAVITKLRLVRMARIGH